MYINVDVSDIWYDLSSGEKQEIATLAIDEGYVDEYDVLSSRVADQMHRIKLGLDSDLTSLEILDRLLQ